DIVTDLLALVAEHAVQAPFQIALDEVAEKAVEFHATMIRPGEAAAAETHGLHPEVAAVLLHEDIRCHLGGAEQRVLALIDGEVFADAVTVLWIGIIPARLELVPPDAGYRDHILTRRPRRDEDDQGAENIVSTVSIVSAAGSNGSLTGVGE